MRRIIQNIVLIAVIAAFAAAVAIPVAAAVSGLTYTAGWETNDWPSHLDIRSTLTYSGGNGQNVHYWSNTVTNTGILSTLVGDSTAASVSAYGNWASCNNTELPFVRFHDGGAYYD